MDAVVNIFCRCKYSTTRHDEVTTGKPITHEAATAGTLSTGTLDGRSCKHFLPLQIQHHGTQPTEVSAPSFRLQSGTERFRQERLMDAVANIFCRCKCTTTGNDQVIPTRVYKPNRQLAVSCKHFLPLQMQHHGKANNEMKHKLPECFRQERLMDAVVNIFCRCKCNTTGHCKKSVQAGFNERTCKHFSRCKCSTKGTRTLHAVRATTMLPFNRALFDSQANESRNSNKPNRVLVLLRFPREGLRRPPRNTTK